MAAAAGVGCEIYLLQLQRRIQMSDLDKLKKENKKLRALLKNAVELLNQSKKLLKRPEKLGAAKKKRKK
jgi:hypothetical protein